MAKTTGRSKKKAPTRAKRGKKSVAKKMLKRAEEEEENKQNKAASSSMIKRNWTPEEDLMLLHLINGAPLPPTKRGIKWNAVSKTMKTRNGKQCRDRWFNHLRPNVNTSTLWTIEEDRTLVKLQSQHGNKWTMFAERLNRYENNVKNHWYSPAFAPKRDMIVAQMKSAAGFEWTQDEDDLLIEYHSMLGDNWEEIAEKLVRTVAAVRARWSSKHLVGQRQDYWGTVRDDGDETPIKKTSSNIYTKISKSNGIQISSPRRTSTNTNFLGDDGADPSGLFGSMNLMGPIPVVNQSREFASNGMITTDTAQQLLAHDDLAAFPYSAAVKEGPGSVFEPPLIPNFSAFPTLYDYPNSAHQKDPTLCLPTPITDTKTANNTGLSKTRLASTFDRAYFSPKLDRSREGDVLSIMSPPARINL